MIDIEHVEENQIKSPVVIHFPKKFYHSCSSLIVFWIVDLHPKFNIFQNSINYVSGKPVMVLDKTSQQRGNIPAYIRNLIVVHVFMSAEGHCEIKCKVGCNKSISLVTVNVKIQNTPVVLSDCCRHG